MKTLNGSNPTISPVVGWQAAIGDCFFWFMKEHINTKMRDEIMKTDIRTSVVVPVWPRLQYGISLRQSSAFAAIHNETIRHGHFEGPLSLISYWTRTTTKAVRKYLSVLESKGLITVDKCEVKDHKHIYTCTAKMLYAK